MQRQRDDVEGIIAQELIEFDRKQKGEEEDAKKIGEEDERRYQRSIVDTADQVNPIIDKSSPVHSAVGDELTDDAAHINGETNHHESKLSTINLGSDNNDEPADKKPHQATPEDAQDHENEMVVEADEDTVIY